MGGAGEELPCINSNSTKLNPEKNCFNQPRFFKAQNDNWHLKNRSPKRFFSDVLSYFCGSPMEMLEIA